MENLSIHDPPHPGGPQPGVIINVQGQGLPASAPPPPQAQQLPPQMFTTAAQLLDLTDSKTAKRGFSFLVTKRDCG
jgi:U6 snRNA-associated Sm-like protein LSm1